MATLLIHTTRAQVTAAAAVAPVGFDVDLPEDMDFEATCMKRSQTEAADDDVQDHKIIITNYENDDEL
jgi:hypothetical protein